MESTARSKSNADASILKKYVKVIQALSDLEATLADAGRMPPPETAQPVAVAVHVEAAPVSILALPAAAAAALRGATVTEELCRNRGHRGDFTTAWDWLLGSRLRWVLLVYLPGVFTAGAVIFAALVLSHIYENPETLVDIVWEVFSSLPAFFGGTWSRMSAAAYNKVFRWRSSVVQRNELPMAGQLQVAAPSSLTTPSPSSSWMFYVILALGLVLAFRPPAQPARPQGWVG